MNSTNIEHSWISLLFIPANSERFIKSAHTRGASGILIDLEDSIAIDAKASARKDASTAIELLSSQAVDCLVRVNSEPDLCKEDLQAVIHKDVEAICLPKVSRVDQLQKIDALIGEIETSRGLPVGKIRLIAIIETIEALLDVNNIAKASPRLMGIGLGSEDLSLDGGFEPTSENLFDPCQRIIYAARAAKIHAFGFPGSISNFSDLDEFSGQIKRAKSMGFNGAFCIHPKQIEIVNDVFTAAPQSIEAARDIVEAFDALGADDTKVLNIDGKMIDLPVVERARRLLTSHT